MIQSVAKKKNREVNIYFSLLIISTSFYPFGLFLYIFGGLPSQICKYRDKNYWKMALGRHEQVNWKLFFSLNNERIHRIRAVQEHDSARLQAIFWMKNLMPFISLNLQKDGFVKEICLLLLKWNVTWLMMADWVQPKIHTVHDYGQRGITFDRNPESSLFLF